MGLMLTSTLALPLALVASAASLVSAHGSHGGARHQRIARAVNQAPSGHHWSTRQLPGTVAPKFQRRSRRSRARATSKPSTELQDPESLSKGSLTVAQGCTGFYKVKPNDSCYSAIAAAGTPGLTLEEFYKINPQVNNLCYNLWTGYQYCISTSPVKASKHHSTAKTSAKKPAAVAPAPVVKAPAVKAPAVKAAAPKVVTPAPSSEDTEDDEGECDADEVSSDDTPKTTSSDSSSSTKSNDNTDTEKSTPTTNDDDTSSNGKKASGVKVQANVNLNKPSPTASPSPSPSPKSNDNSDDSGDDSGSSSGSSGGSLAALTSAGITGFINGVNTGIGSWFRTNSGQDSTNGHSWCFNPYDDSMPGFAADVTTMLNNFGGSNVKAGQAYCGLEAKVTTADGKSMLMYLADGFDSKWVKTPGSIDIIISAWEKLAGYSTNNKNDVLQVTWEWTGNKNSAFAFNGGNPVGGGWRE